MFINQFIKKIILVLLLLVLSVPAMPISWPSLATIEKICREKVSEEEKNMIEAALVGCMVTGLSIFCFKTKRNIAGVVLACCIPTCWEIFNYWKKEHEKKKREELEQESKKDENILEKMNNEVDCCVICFLDETETEEQLLEGIHCPSGRTHPARNHQSCLNRALYGQSKCPMCRFIFSVQDNLSQQHTLQFAVKEEIQRSLRVERRAEEEIKKISGREKRRSDEEEKEQKIAKELEEWFSNHRKRGSLWFFLPWERGKIIEERKRSEEEQMISKRRVQRKEEREEDQKILNKIKIDLRASRIMFERNRRLFLIKKMEEEGAQREVV